MKFRVCLGASPPKPSKLGFDGFAGVPCRHAQKFRGRDFSHVPRADPHKTLETVEGSEGFGGPAPRHIRKFHVLRKETRFPFAPAVSRSPSQPLSQPAASSRLPIAEPHASPLKGKGGRCTGLIPTQEATP
jgi:hypothetical protein